MVYLDLLDKLSIKYYLNHLMKNHTTLKVGGRALIYVVPKSYKELSDCIDVFNDKGIKYKILGNGSNVLISDKGYNGAIISTKKLDFISFNGNVVKASCGVNLSSLIKKCKEQNLSGLEKLFGIPATVGGAICMNAGAFYSTVSDRIIEVCALNKGKLVRLDKNQCAFSYRNSRFLRSNLVVLSATFALDSLERSFIEKEIKNCTVLRRKTQPISRSCGSVFKNTGFAPAGLIIDKCGLKGFTLGRANVSNVHSNFINVKEGCTAKEIYDLILTVKEKVKEKFNVTLKEEVEFLGEF